MTPPPRRALPHLAALLLVAACAATPAAHDARAQPATPALAEIFSIPGPHGEAPRAQSLSAGGDWCLVAWRAVEVGADGRRSWAAQRGPYLVSTRGEACELDASASLAALIERLEREAHATGSGTRVVDALEGWKPARPGATAWSQSGNVLAVEWEHALVLLALPAAGACPLDARRVLYKDPPEREDEAPKDEPPAEAAPPAAAALAAGESAPWPERLGDVGSLEFSDDDAELRVRNSEELFVFPLRDGRAWPLGLSDTHWPTRDLAPPFAGVQASRDRRAFLGTARPLGKLESTADDGTKSESDAQFLDLRGPRKVVLEGWAASASLESARLSPDGRFVFAADVERSAQPPPTLVPDYLTERVTTTEGRRELAEDVWPSRRLWLWNTDDGARSALDAPGERNYGFADIGWSPCALDGVPACFAFRRTASDFRTLETWVWSARGLRLVLSERDARWVGGPGGFARWSHDGTRLLLASECLPEASTPGRSQLFELDPHGGTLHQITAVEGEVQRFEELDDGRIVFCASRADPARRELGLAERDPASGAWRTRWYRTPPGMNTSPRPSAHGETVVYEHGELGLPDELWVSTLDGDCRPLTRTVPGDWLAQRWILPVKLDARQPDGTRVRAHVYLPRATSLARPDRRRPCIVFIHGAGYLQNVSDSMTEYAVNLMFHSRLASLGYVVADVDYRGSAGYGAEFRGAVQFELGALELADIGLVVDELARRGVIDAARVGCYGGSYGGFLTLMALFTQPERWSCGAALRSVTDWRTYHPGYTQPRLGRPSTHAEAYARSSPIDHAEGLQDPLLILHGMRDTNVFAQDSIRLIEKLIVLGKDFDAMLYPSQGHGFEDGAHWIDEYGRIERFLIRHLGAP